MSDMKVLIFGSGYSGRAYARALRGTSAAIAGTTRSAEKAVALEAAGVRPVLLSDGDRAGFHAELASTTHLVVSAAPGETGDPLLAIASEALLDRAPVLQWVGYLSTVGVYGDHDGEWVSEESECRPSQQRTEARVAAERAWLELGDRRDLPVSVLRLSGIYGPGRNALANLAAGTARRIIKPGQIFNRIHVADIAGALVHLGERRASGVFNVSDDEPSPPQDVITYAAALMGVEPPPELDFDTADLSPMARSFYGESKRVSNAKLRKSGYVFQFADYRHALTAMWADRSWRSETQE